MYYCPHCDDGPFSAADWWDHVDSHDNASWLQHRDPKNLDRTDLGYGEDLQRTTVPTHDMPNEKDVWNSVSPYGWHEDLTGQPFDGGLSTDPPGAHMGVNLLNKDEVWNMYPDASEYSEIHHGSHPFIFDPSQSNLLIGRKGDSHQDLLYGRSNYLNTPENLNQCIWGRYFPQNNSADIFEGEGNTPEGQEALDHLRRYFKTAAQTIPDAHRLVWLSQPNDNSLKYWHHRPSNTTYAWNIDESDPTKDHWFTSDHIHENYNHPDKPGTTNDWEGGFWNEQSGKHPADLWGLPASTDYASIQGDGDYGNTVW